jgi:hypothetical protein
MARQLRCGIVATVAKGFAHSWKPVKLRLRGGFPDA